MTVVFWSLFTDKCKFSETILSVEKVWNDDELVVIPWWIYPVSDCIFDINAFYSTAYTPGINVIVAAIFLNVKFKNATFCPVTDKEYPICRDVNIGKEV